MDLGHLNSVGTVKDWEDFWSWTEQIVHSEVTMGLVSPDKPFFPNLVLSGILSLKETSNWYIITPLL